jgi:hypothetical protein
MNLKLLAAGVRGLYLSATGYEHVTGFGEYGNELVSSLTCWKFN